MKEGRGGGEWRMEVVIGSTLACKRKKGEWEGKCLTAWLASVGFSGGFLIPVGCTGPVVWSSSSSVI